MEQKQKQPSDSILLPNNRPTWNFESRRDRVPDVSFLTRSILPLTFSVTSAPQNFCSRPRLAAGPPLRISYRLTLGIGFHRKVACLRGDICSTRLSASNKKNKVFRHTFLFHEAFGRADTEYHLLNWKYRKFIGWKINSEICKVII